LFACHGDVDQVPEDHPWPEFIEEFDVEGADARVEFATDEPLWEKGQEKILPPNIRGTHVVKKVAGITASSEEFPFSEGEGVDVKGLDQRVGERASEDAGPVEVDERESARTAAENETGRESQRKQKGGKR